LSAAIHPPSITEDHSHWMSTNGAFGNVLALV
jgi:hypothetical protein